MRVYGCYRVDNRKEFDHLEEKDEQIEVISRIYKCAVLCKIYKNDKDAIDWCNRCFKVKDEFKAGKITEKVAREILQEDLHSDLANLYNYQFTEVE